MQDRIKINGVEIWQPDKDAVAYNLETTYTDDSGRVTTGKGHFTALFTIEQLGYSVKNIPIKEASKILKQVGSGKYFTLHYFSPFYGQWRDGIFMVGQGSMQIGTLIEGQERLSSLSFNMTGVDPI